MANTFLPRRARGRQVAVRARPRRHRARHLDKAKAKGCEIVLPVDVVVAQGIQGQCAVARRRRRRGRRRRHDPRHRPAQRRRARRTVLARAKTLVWNGPFGAFELEPFDARHRRGRGSRRRTDRAGKLVSVAGGGDTVAALNQPACGRFTYVSTAGGAFLEWMEGKALPGVEVLRVK
jgi:phosphoglycerate kinase